MQRQCFECSPLDGYRVPRTESIAASVLSGQLLLYGGTNDGTLVQYDCAVDARGAYSATMKDSPRVSKQSKEKKSIQQLTVVDSWNLLIGIMDGMIIAYEFGTNQKVSELPDTKGCIFFAANDRSSMLYVAMKKKLLFYLWTGSEFQLKRDINSTESIKSLIYSSSANSIIVGYKRYYEAIDMLQLKPTRILEFEKEHKMLCLELHGSSIRPSSLLLSIGAYGVLMDVSEPGKFGKNSGTYEERFEWTSPPISLHLVSPFVISLSTDCLEVHDIASLTMLQKIPLSSTNGLLSLQPVSLMNGATTAFVSTGEAIMILKMIPLGFQVTRLVESGLYEEAINLSTLCRDNISLRDIDIPKIHEKFANSLLLKGDYEGAVTNFIAASTNPITVLAQFPDLIPISLHSWAGIVPGGKSLQASKLTGMILHRAAAALVQFCEHHRSQIKLIADRAEKIKNAGIGASSISLDEIVCDPDDAIRVAELLDTLLLSSLVNCAPPRRTAAVDLLSSHNRCNVESCTVMLASQGNAFTEALLWLYRSHNEHKKVLAVLTEERCVGAGAWTKEQFYSWMSEYLRWLWYHEDPALPMLVLPSLKILTEYDAELGLSILTTKGKSKLSSSSFGGKGVTVQEVVSLLESVVINRLPNVTTSIRKKRSSLGSNGIAIPLINGRAVGVAYLEWLVNSGAAPASMHNEFAQLLMEGVPLEVPNINHSSNNLDPHESDNETVTLYKIYRRKLQSFLETSMDYSPERILKFLPPQFLHEYALILSRLGKHEEVLSIYIHQLNDFALAEAYCTRIYNRANVFIDSIHGFDLASNVYTKKGNAPRGDANNELNVYFSLIKVILESSTKDNNAVSTAIAMAEKYYDRIDSTAFIDILPKDVPVSDLCKYFSIAIEFGNTKRKNLQIIHQLLRVSEVNVRTNK